jgi:hypothetical protein
MGNTDATSGIASAPRRPRTSCHSSGRSTPYCRFRHIRRTTSSPSFRLAPGWSGRRDTPRPGPARTSRTSVAHSVAEDSGAENSGVVLRALAGLKQSAVAHMRHKRWTGHLPLPHSAGRRQAKVDSRSSPQCITVDLVENAAKVRKQKAGRPPQPAQGPNSSYIDASPPENVERLVLSPSCPQLYPRAGSFTPIQILSILRT